MRIEDTDRKRYVADAEQYIRESLAWAGIEPDEGPKIGGNYGPYRQSERRDIYQKYVRELIERGQAYYAFDTEAELDERREAEKARGNHNFRYDATTRGEMRNSLTLSREEAERLLDEGSPYVVRLRVEPGETVYVKDIVRGDVSFQSDEVDDKVLMKADGLPTYHLANVVDDHLMRISHVIRGEEWLPSTALHVLLYRAFGWEDSMPQFAHLPLLLKPSGKGKLSKRDGEKLGIPVFSLDFRDAGFLSDATVNFLAFLGWNPGTEQELFSLEELIGTFGIDRIVKSGARYDYDKARWFNQQYLIASDDADLGREYVGPLFAGHGHILSTERATAIAGLLKERVHTTEEFWEQGRYFVERVGIQDEKTARKKWKPERRAAFERLRDRLAGLTDWRAAAIKQATVDFMEREGLNFGAVLPVLRLAVSGTTSGPDAFAILEVIGREETVGRLEVGYAAMDGLVG